MTVVRLLPNSARRRRRLLRIAVVLGVLALVGGGVAMIPRGHSAEPKPEVVTDAVPEPAIPVVQTTNTLSPAERRAIDRTFDRFVPAVVERKNLAAGYDVVTPDMRDGQTRAAWAKSDPPVMLFRTNSRRFHDWRLTWRQGNEASIELVLQPPTRKGQAISFNVDVKRMRNRWLVESIAPQAIFDSSTHRVTAAKDFLARGGNVEPSEEKGALAGIWIVLPLSILGIVPLVLIGLWVLSWVRNQRARRAYSRGLWS